MPSTLFCTFLCRCFARLQSETFRNFLVTRFEPRANGRIIVGQLLPTLRDVTCCVRLHTLFQVVGCCCVLLRKVWSRSTFQPTTPNISFLLLKRSATMLDPFVGATHAHYAWFTKTYGFYPSHDALQVPTLLGVVASVCTPLPTRTASVCKPAYGGNVVCMSSCSLIFFTAAHFHLCSR